VAEPDLRRLAIAVDPARREQAIAVLVEHFPDGFEETDEGFAVVVAADAPAPELPGWMALSVAAVPVGWRDAWRAFHAPCAIAGTWIRPPWLAEPPGAVVLEPGYAFGTGSHPTTRGVGELLAREPAGSVLDLGCGSGLLSILAARWGHGPVTAWDLDPHAVAAARANVERNGLGDRVAVAQADVLTAALPACDLALANIEWRVVEALLARPGLSARVIASGLRADEPLDLGPWRVADERVEDGWRTLLLTR
jgi:ribosomal protein L11 methyltransferase